ncbi:tumor necrosis factor (ligand) superfamily, member 10 like 4 [Clarias gariepinus]
MTLNIQSNACYNACYNTCYNLFHRAPGASAGATPRTLSFLLLVVVLGVETLITAVLLYSFTHELHTTNESLDFDFFPTECFHQHGGDPAATRTVSLESCELMMQELQNSVNTRLLLNIRNSLWQSLGEHNITQDFKAAIHVGAKHKLKQYHHLQRTGDPHDSQLTLDRLNWEVLSGQNTQEGLMILSPDGEIVIPQNGIYFVYSQVNFVTSNLKPDLQLVQYLFKGTRLYAEPMMLSKAVASRHLDVKSREGLYSSHQGALFQLEQGDRLSLCVSNMDAVLLQPEATYFGAFILD